MVKGLRVGWEKLDFHSFVSPLTAKMDIPFHHTGVQINTLLSAARR